MTTKLSTRRKNLPMTTIITFPPDPAKTVLDLVRAAGEWAAESDLPEGADEDIVLARLISSSSLSMIEGIGFMPLTANQWERLYNLLREAANYWVVCGYADSEDGDAWLGNAGEAINFLDQCWETEPWI
jgi:hypothetical protein